MARCLKYTVKEAFYVVQGLTVLGGRQAGKPSVVKRTVIKTHTKYSKHGRGALHPEEGLGQVFTWKFIEGWNALNERV